ncbi:hypothetical protein [Lysobacter capsici]|uniref:hypothetical protein n=1 Tax=Lysobacter capsici TaxID=435897 RepID=UPI00287BB3EB|nr:hypothetical protein [Lysobacter capsici]WND78956.1 hypothetical protein RJ610_16810 [Lysobacter capsici]WND84151.1 hypothetical protein RJ609_16820 [Lysobacter capsici]
MILTGGVMAVVTGSAMVIASPELHEGWSLFAFGALFLIGLAFTLSIYNDQRALRADVAGGIKLWRDGRVHAMTVSEDSDSGRSNYRVEIAIDPAPDSDIDIDTDPPSPLSFAVDSNCYHSIAQGDRVRIAYTPHQVALLNLVNGNRECVTVAGCNPAIPPSP